MQLTEQQARIYRYLETYLRGNGRPPSYQEIQRHFNFRSLNSVTKHLKQLERKGYLESPWGNQKRAFQLLPLRTTAASEECKEEIEKAMNYGVIPICPPNDLVSDYNGSKEEGDGFVYKENSPWSFFASFIRAIENFKFPYDWRTIQVAAMTEPDEEDDEEEITEE